MGAVVLLVLAIAGALGFAEAVVGAVSVFALAMFYHLTVGTAPHSSAPIAAPAEPSPQDAPAALVDEMVRERLPVPVLVIGPGGRIEHANPAAREFLGLGSHTGHLSAALRQPQVLEAVNSALRGGAVEPIEYSMMAPIESHVRAFVTPLKVDEASTFPWRALLVLFDETSIKRAERMRADFLANASHELRTPLASLAGFIETLRGHAKDDAGARDRFLSIMGEQTERMRRLIDDLLSLSRVEMNEHVPPNETADLVTLTEDVLDFLRPQIDEKQISIETDLAKAAVAVGDRDQLTEVTQNLIENAIKYSPSGSKLRIEIVAGLARDAAERPARRCGELSSRLTLAAPPSEAGLRYVAFRVIDQGAGIDRRFLPRLTERFYRVDGQKSGPKEGTGLGLAIVKHIVNRHRGGFAVESAPGVGSVFSVFVPEKRSLDEAREEAGEEPGEEAGPR